MNSGEDDDSVREPGREPVCAKCRYFYLTWEPGQRYGCRAFSFKSQQLPSLVVFNVDNRHCNSFQSSRSGDQARQGRIKSGQGKPHRINFKV